MARLLSVLSLSLLLTACVVEDAELLDDVEADRLAGIGHNGIGHNGIGHNGIGMRGLTGAALSVNPDALDFLRNNALSYTTKHPLMMEILDDESSQELLTYLVECALEPGDALVLQSADGTFKKNVLGAFGIAPEWHYGLCEEGCQRRVSACLFSRINPTREYVMISARTPALPSVHPHLYDLPKRELVGFPRNEGSFFGNYFVWEYRVGHPQIYACAADDSDPRYEDLVMRLCGDMANPFEYCRDIVLGSCATDIKCPLPAGSDSKACAGPSDKNGAAANCSDNQNLCAASGPVEFYDEVVTVYRSHECAHPDYVEGGPLHPMCSPCAYRLSEELPHCTTTRWDGACVKASAMSCPDHSIRAIGAPLTRGTSDAVTAVCDFMPSCCDTAWTSTCRSFAYWFYF